MFELLAYLLFGMAFILFEIKEPVGAIDQIRFRKIIKEQNDKPTRTSTRRRKATK